MFDRPYHQRIAKILQALNSDLLLQAKCYFAGGTAIVPSLAEYRESLDIDFLCASNAGYRLLRNTVSASGLGALLKWYPRSIGNREYTHQDRVCS